MNLPKYPYILRVYLRKETSAKLASTAATYRIGKSALASMCIDYVLTLPTVEVDKIIQKSRREFLWFDYYIIENKLTEVWSRCYTMAKV